MKKITLTLLTLFTTLCIFAQKGNIVVFSEGGERFTIVLNGIKHNTTPQTNVKVENLSEAPYKAKIIFEDRTIEPMSKTLYANAGMENTYNIKRKSKDNSLVIRMSSQTAVKSTPIVKETVVVNTSTPKDVNTTHTTTTTTTIINDNSDVNSGGSNESISMNVNIGGLGMNVNINDNTSHTTNDNVDMNMDVKENYTYTETTTVTTTSGGNVDANPISQTKDHRCDYPMDNSDFLDGKKSIESKTFADSKMTIAKQITKANCPTAVQIRDFTKLFTFESGKVEYAKFAYQYCYDVANYYKVNDAFQFESSIDELNEHIGE